MPKENKAETVVLMNKTRRMLVVNLTRKEAKRRKFPVIRKLKNGASVGEFTTRLCPDSITFLAKERKPVPAEYLSIPEIRNALQARPSKLVIVKS